MTRLTRICENHTLRNEKRGSHWNLNPYYNLTYSYIWEYLGKTETKPVITKQNRSSGLKDKTAVKSKPNRTIEIVAGPNGSGKSTFAQAYFRLQNGHARFINADTIASGLAAGKESQAAFHAGRVMLAAITDAFHANENFSFESTLSGKTWRKTLEEARKRGYQLTIYFVYLEKISLNIKRVQQRVREGGHSIPKETILRRFPRSFENFWKVYRPLCNSWFIFDNSGSKPKQIQSKTDFDRLEKLEQLRFEKMFLKLGMVP